MYKDKYYCAYGSNLNLANMAKMCPNSKPFKTGYIDGYELVFRGKEEGFLNIVTCPGSVVPVLMWEIDERDIDALNTYESFPDLYDIVDIDVISDGVVYNCYVYEMREKFDYKKPSDEYIEMCEEGYKDNGFDLNMFNKIVEKGE